MARATSTVESVTGASAVRTTSVTNYAGLVGVSGKGIGIAVLDSGIAWQHADFKFQRRRDAVEGLHAIRRYRLAVRMQIEKARSDDQPRRAEEARVERWLSVAARTEGFSGFAIGRTIWRDTIRAYVRNERSREDAIEEIAENYLAICRRYLSCVLT